MLRRILLIAAVMVVGAYGVAEAASGNKSSSSTSVSSNGAGQGNGAGESNPNTNNKGANPSNPPKDGCKPSNVPPKGERPAVDDPRCPNYNGNAENSFRLSTTSIDKPQTITVWGGWCGGNGTVTFKIGNHTVGTLPVNTQRIFNGPLTFDNEPTGSNLTLSAICSTGTRTASITVVP